MNVFGWMQKRKNYDTGVRGCWGSVQEKEVGSLGFRGWLTDAIEPPSRGVQEKRIEVAR